VKLQFRWHARIVFLSLTLSAPLAFSQFRTPEDLEAKAWDHAAGPFSATSAVPTLNHQWRDSEAYSPRQSGTISVAEMASPLRGKAQDLIQKARQQLRKNKTADAFETLNASLHNAVARPYALCILGAEHLKLIWEEPSLLDTALEELEEGVGVLPGDAATQSNFALALLVKGDFGRGVQHAQKAVQLNPSAAKSRYLLGRLLSELGHYDEALYHLKLAARDIQIAQELLVEVQQRVSVAQVR
jgi:tetratricopeptide (TPR) repeat protein